MSIAIRQEQYDCIKKLLITNSKEFSGFLLYDYALKHDNELVFCCNRFIKSEGEITEVLNNLIAKLKHNEKYSIPFSAVPNEDPQINYEQIPYLLNWNDSARFTRENSPNGVIVIISQNSIKALDKDIARRVYIQDLEGRLQTKN